MSIDPPRNFTLTLEERVRALGGPPAYMRRKRAIEDLEESLLARVRARIDAGMDAASIARDAERDGTTRDITRLNELIAKHNRYYPMEANLPYSAKTGQMLERPFDKPWAPLEVWSIERLIGRVLDRV